MPSINNLITKLPVNDNNKLKLLTFLKRVYWFFKYDKETYKFAKENQVFVNSNHYYGHEYWLKKYSGYPDYIYGIIEHGVYFGENRALICPKEEWSMGNVFTYGDSRIGLLKELHPDMNVYAIGPRIHYAEIDEEYYDELYNQIDHTGKVLTLYPFHSLAAVIHSYNSDLFLEQAKGLADKIGAKTILVSLHPSDYKHNLDLNFKDKKVIIVGGGNKPHKFLPRLRAIFKISDLTFSNSLGTHVGYSIYMGTPHIMNLESNTNLTTNEIFKDEQNAFATAFNGDDPLAITQDQIALCDKYFGFSHLKSPDQLYNILCDCRSKYKSIYYNGKNNEKT